MAQRYFSDNGFSATVAHSVKRPRICEAGTERLRRDEVTFTKAFMNTLGYGGCICLFVTDDIGRRGLKQRVKVAMNGIIDDSTFRARRCAGFTDSQAWPEHKLVQRYFFEDLTSRFQELRWD
jgi:hypothetical protein